jgi:hypothetical protein
VLVCWAGFIASAGSLATLAEPIFCVVVTAGKHALAFALPQNLKIVLALGVCTRNLGAASAPPFAVAGIDQRAIVMVALGVPLHTIATVDAARMFGVRAGSSAAPAQLGASGMVRAMERARSAPLAHALLGRVKACCTCALLVCTALAHGADFGTPGGPMPANIGTIADVLRQDRPDMELLISYGTSKGGSAGHLALALRDPARDDERVYSANYYADRSRKHEQGFYTDELMIVVPKLEYLYGTSSSLGDKASFGLDFGEVYKRSVIGIRVYGVPAAERQALAAFFQRINDDYRRQARDTEYHDGEVKYDYLRLNCAKTIGAGFRFGAGYRDLEVTSAPILPRRRLVAAANANIPTEMAMKLVEAWHARGYGLDVVLYQKYSASTYVDPDTGVAFKDLPNRFPSVLSRDFRREQGRYEDFDNLYAMYLLYNLAKYRLKVNDATQLIEISQRKTPMAYEEAAALALRDALTDSENYLRGLPVPPKDTGVEEASSATDLNNATDLRDKK